MAPATDTIDRHLAQFPPEQEAALQRVRAVARAAVPGAVEILAWGMPTLKIGVDERGKGGDNVLSFDGFRNHSSLFPNSGAVTAGLLDDLAGFTVSKGTIQFPKDRAFPAPLLRRLIRNRLAEINASYPRSSGEMREYHANGFLKFRGRLKNGDLTGRCEWFRRDGSLLRAGTFRSGQRLGAWTT